MKRDCGHAHLCCSFEHPLCDFGLAANTDGVICANLADKLVLGHGFGIVVNMPSLFSELGDGIETDVLQNQEPEVLVFEGVEDFWLANCIRHGVATTGREDSIME